VLVVYYGKEGVDYVVEGELTQFGGRIFNMIREGVGLIVGSWLDDNIGCEVGDGSVMLFWWDVWLEGGALKVRVKRLYDLSENKLATILKMNLLGWGVDGEACKWRGLLVMEEDHVRE